MAIKRQDGSTYKLAGPNKLMEGQNFWKGKCILHNFFFQEEIQDAPPSPPKEIIEQKEEKLVEKPVETPKQVIPQPSPKTRIHCLPAIIQERKHELYGEVVQSITYGQPFIFEGVVVFEDDLSVKVQSEQEVAFGSIIFPKNLSKRWWKVNSYENQIITGYPSEIQPAF